VRASMTLDIPAGTFDAYLFDLDGTLVDSMPIHFRAWEEMMQRHGLKGPLSEDLFYALGGVPAIQVAERVAAEYGLRVDAVAVAEEKEALYRERIRQVQVIAPVAEFARTVARTHPVAVVTGGTPDVALPALEATGLRALFPVVVTPLDVAPGRGKPAPDMFLEAARRLGVAPARTLVFEDAQPGFEAAIAAGMALVRVPSRGR
jgi:HAD superfamily hydrolase (TIGR01509 family)